MFDNITRHFSLKGDDRIAIGTSLDDLEIPEEKNNTTPVDLNERDIDSIEIDDHAIIDDLIHVDDDVDNIENPNDENNVADTLHDAEIATNKQADESDPFDEVLEFVENEDVRNDDVEPLEDNNNESDDSDIEIV